MTFDIYIPLKISEKEQAKIDEALKNGYDSRSKFIRDCINDHNLSIEEIKLRAELRGYNACVTELQTNRDFVLQRLKNVTNPNERCYNVTLSSVENTEKVTQSNTNSEENVENVTQNEDVEKTVTPKSNTNHEENVAKVTSMSDDPRYQLYKEYLPDVSKQINMLGNWTPEIKKKISEETATTPKEVVGFLYQYKQEISDIPYESDVIVTVDKDRTK